VPHSVLSLPRILTSRRRFLSGAGALVCAWLPAGAALAAASSTRSISFINTHTGERLSSVYFREGQYVSSELQRLNGVLRDFRTGEIHPIDPQTLDILADLRVLADRDEPYELICGYRSPATNAMLRSRSAGVAEHSLHLQGRALDVRLPGVPTARLRDLALGMSRGGVGYYAASDFVHLDNGPVRHW
jgi:uncharacterized protein YcbK (DUF882 family)